MIFEFLVSSRAAPDWHLETAVTELLAEVLSANDNEFDDETVTGMIQLRHTRACGSAENDDGEIQQLQLGAFAPALPEETASVAHVVDEFTAALSDTPPMLHVLKFEDPLLKAELAERAAEIFELEMKLRRVLSLVYLYAQQDGDPFDLLCRDHTKPMSKKPLKVDDLRAAAENEFFHLTFSQYVHLNKRPDIKSRDILETLQAAEDFESFRAELQRRPVEHEGDANLLASLKDQLEPIESMRNCVAHNRRPSNRVSDNYQNALPQLNTLLDDYLGQIGSKN